MSATTTPHSTAWSKLDDWSRRAATASRSTQKPRLRSALALLSIVTMRQRQVLVEWCCRTCSFTTFKDKELVTKAYVDGAIGDIDIPMLT